MKCINNIFKNMYKISQYINKTVDKVKVEHNVEENEHKNKLVMWQEQSLGSLIKAVRSWVGISSVYEQQGRLEVSKTAVYAAYK